MEIEWDERAEGGQRHTQIVRSECNNIIYLAKPKCGTCQPFKGYKQSELSQRLSEMSGGFLFIHAVWGRVRSEAIAGSMTIRQFYL